jgi:hypothetical protein
MEEEAEAWRRLVRETTPEMDATAEQVERERASPKTAAGAQGKEQRVSGMGKGS